MWRQVFVICLLITLSDFWNGVQARTETEPMAFEELLDRVRSFKARNIGGSQRGHVDTGGPEVESQVNNQDAGIAKDVNEPGSADTDTSKTLSNTGKVSKQNETGKSTSQPKHGSALPAVHTPGKEKTYAGFASSDKLFIVMVAACSVAGLVGIIMAGVCWYKLNRSAKAASEVEYPAYGVTGPNKDRIPSPGDRKLAQSAQMYHYQHQKQQMIAMEKANGEMKHDASDEESEEENEEGDYTVYECPGLAPTGEMEVKNPLFSDETPVTPGAGDDHKEGGH